MIQSILDQGDRIVFDLHHYVRLTSELEIPIFNSTLEDMVPYISEVQVPIGRADFKTAAGSINRMYTDLVTGTKDSVGTKLLLKVLEIGFNGPLIPEIDPLGVGLLTDLHQVHKTTVIGIKKLINPN